MCGLFAWLSRNAGPPPDVAQARRAVATLTHRGPDGAGEWMGPGLYIGHRRLRVIDLSADADQPFVINDGAIVVSYNGEIYNYRELADELRRTGVTFRTSSDTEVFAAAYAAWGTDAFSRFDGMFAAAIWDARNGTLVLVRDPMGQKPLYFAETRNAVVCASELRALLALDGFGWTLDRKATARFLANACFMGEETPVRGVRKVPPGHYMVFGPGEKTTEPRRYWTSFPGDDVLDMGEDEAVAEFDRLFSRGCLRTLRSDVPLGVFLSGGIDSSLIASYAAAHLPSLQSYTLAMAECDFDESAGAAVSARLAGIARHRAFEMDDAAMNAVHRHFATCDEPHGDPGFVNSLLLAERARPEIVVAVAGDGADELFWGYETFKALVPDMVASRLPAGLVSAAARIVGAFLPATDRYLDGRYRLEAFAGGYPAAAALRPAHWLSALRPGELGALCPGLDADFFHPTAGHDHLFSPFEKTQEELPSESPELRLAYFYQRHFLPDFVSTHTDRAAMQVSLEVRSPYLSPDIISFANRLPARLKRRGWTLKVLLREVLRRRGYPEDFINQRKRGFTFPVARALKTGLKPLMSELLGLDCLYDGLIDRGRVTGLVDQHMAGARNNYRILFNLMALAAWRRNYPQVS